MLDAASAASARVRPPRRTSGENFIFGLGVIGKGSNSECMWLVADVASV